MRISETTKSKVGQRVSAIAQNVSGLRPSDVDVPLISESLFPRFRAFLHQQFGLAVEDDKRVHVSARVRGLAANAGFGSLDEYVEDLLSAHSQEKLDALINRVSTNHTYFFREGEHFTLFLEHALPAAMERAERRGDRTLRIWSAASSSGQEPYSLIMALRDLLGASYDTWDIKILGTDISAKVLAQAKEGVYQLDIMDKLTPEQVRRHFDVLDGSRVQVKESTRARLDLKRFNLTTPKWPFHHPFDVVFCRNVLIYFDAETTAKVIRNIEHCLAPGGFLFVGQSESIQQVRGQLDYVAPSVFRRSA